MSYLRIKPCKDCGKHPLFGMMNTLHDYYWLRLSCGSIDCETVVTKVSSNDEEIEQLYAKAQSILVKEWNKKHVKNK
jgi:hypothetical protein